MTLTKLSLGGNKFNYSQLETGISITFFYSVEWKEEGMQPPTPCQSGLIYNHDEMYARKRELPLCVLGE